MLTIKQIKANYPDMSDDKSFLKNVIVEYIQYELLDTIYKQKKSEMLSFMGGTSIRIADNGNRFSEDLDFDNFGLSYDDFKNLSKDVIRDMKLKGFNLDYRTVKKGAFHCYIKFPEILERANLSNFKNENILVRIDTVVKDKIFKPQISSLNKFGIYRDILVNPPEIIMSQKLLAILGRKRTKGRDFYDVSFMFSFTEPDFDYIFKVSGMKKEVFVDKLIKKCENTDFDEISKDVRLFLIFKEQISRIKNFEAFIKERMNKYLE